ncbi:hypothetical protein LUZ60_015878 [Juncus effusus]|nr:hypothetical protein LUZ60_015878 [Juncus effusus]
MKREMVENKEAFDQVLAVVDSWLRRIGWRLRPQSKQKLSNDILALCTGIRSAILIDYGGIMPQLQNNLAKLLHHARKESNLLKPLRVMIISEMVYLIHVKGLAELAFSSLQSPCKFHLLDLETDPPKFLASNVEGNALASALIQIQKKFSEAFPVGIDENLMPILPKEETKLELKSELELESLCVDLTGFIQHVEISIPTLNGWLLGYPVTYLFSNEKLEKATKSISMQSLHIYKIYISRTEKGGIKREYELMGFTVPCGLSIRGEREPWAEEFLARMREKLEVSSNVWSSVWMNVETITEPRSVVF